MWLYLIIFFLVVISANIAKTQRQQQQYFKFIMIFLAIFVGVSDMLGGYDRYIYCELWEETAEAYQSGKNVLLTRLIYYYGNELGFFGWNILVGVVSQNRYIFIMLTTFLMYFLFYRAIKRQTENPLYALILFLPLTFFFSFTYIRQMLAAGLAWQALQYVDKRNLKMFTLWCLLAFSFHNSAIIFFPVYFIPFKKFSKRWIMVALAVCFILGVLGFAATLFDAYGDIDATRVAGVGFSGDEGFRVAYLIEGLFFFLFINKYYYALGNDKNSLVGLNLSIIFCCVILLFVRSENGGRLGWYFMIGLYSTMSSIFYGVKRLANPEFMTVTCLILYVRILLIWGVLLYPYKSFFTDGVRDGDYIERIYEYDHRYDSDKFYK